MQLWGITLKEAALKCVYFVQSILPESLPMLPAAKSAVDIWGQQFKLDC